MRQRVTQNSKMKVDIQNDFTNSNNLYPKSHPQTLHLLEKYSKIVVPKTTTFKGSLFSQGYGSRERCRRDIGNEPLSKNYWKNKE